MIGRDSREDIDAYGALPWFVGLALAGFVVWVMFAYALPIGA